MHEDVRSVACDTGAPAGGEPAGSTHEEVFAGTQTANVIVAMLLLQIGMLFNLAYFIIRLVDGNHLVITCLCYVVG